ncbi:MAG: lysophospholipid acyltransferase family protein [Candidatus Nanopelagicales bacterium]
MLYWILKVVFLGPLIRLLYRPKIIGKKNIPRRGAAIIASNHQSFSDSIFLPLAVPRKITFLAKSEYFTGRGIKGFFTKMFFAGVGQVPIDRSGGRASEAAVLTAVQILNSGRLLGIYPEGTRSPDGRLYRGRTGIVRIALEANVPIIPVALKGTFDIQPTGTLIPKIKRVTITFGEPMYLEDFQGKEKDLGALRDATNLVMQQIQALGGQTYVDIYATKAKEALQEHRTDSQETETSE